MAELDRQYQKTPFYGKRRMLLHLDDLGFSVNVKRIRRLMRVMSLTTLYPKPNTSLAN
jgi:putative transposase